MSQLTKAASALENISISGTGYSILPCFEGSSGEMTWDALGDRMISTLVDEVAGVNDADFKFGQDLKMMAGKRGKGEVSTWVFVHEKNGVMVFKKRLADSRLCFVGRGIIEKPLAEVAEFIKRVENNMTWDCFLIEANCLQVIQESPLLSAYIGYQRYETKKCMMSTKRDMLYYARCSHQGDRYIQAGLSIRNSNFPCPSDVKRIEVGPGSGWVMDKLNKSSSKTLVTYVGNVDVKGIPIFVMNLVLKRHPLAVHFVRQQMINPSKKAAANLTTPSDYDDDDDDDGWSSHWSLDLPEDFVPTADSNSSTEDCFEQSMPIEHFTKLY